MILVGDNIMTAIAVARDCEMVETFADIYILSVTEQENINEIPSLVIEKAGSGVQPDVAVVDICNMVNSD